jgi:hypothetical protein
MIELPASGLLIDSLFSSWVQGLSVVSVATGRGLVVLGDADGFVHFLNRSFQLNSFQAYQVGNAQDLHTHTHTLARARLRTIDRATCFSPTPGGGR